MTSLDKMINVLDLFEGAHLEWTFEELHERLGYTRSTLYRYLKVLTDAGLLTSLPDIGYTLGPRIAELDYQVRSGDSLIVAARPFMAEIVEEVPGIALLCRRYRNKVLCVHQESGTKAIRSNYERGLARPLLRGAASQIILAYLPSAVVARLYEEQSDAFREVGLGEDLAVVRRSLKAMRQAGYCVTSGQVTAGVTGVAAPVLDGNDNVLGSLSLTFARKNATEEKVAFVADRLAFGARVVTKAVSR